MQPAHPAIGDGRDHHVPWFASSEHLASEFRPPSVDPADKSVRQLDQNRSQVRIASFDQPGIGLTRPAAGVARGDATKTGQLLAGIEAYNKMLSSKGATVDQMVAKSLLELRELQEERKLTNEQMRVMNDRAMRAMLYGKVMTPKERAVMRKVFARLADIFGGEK